MSAELKLVSEKLTTNEEFDVLSDILETLRFKGSIFFRSELASPWGITLAPMSAPRFHIAMTGNCFVGVDKSDAVRVQEMDVVVVPSGNAHWIADQPGRALISSELASEACELHQPFFQDGEITNSLICGMVQFDTESSHPILNALPPILHFEHIKPDTLTWKTIMLIDTVMSSEEKPSRIIANRLAEVLFLQLLDQFIRESEHANGFLGALKDQRIRHALLLIHQEPSYEWSLSNLGERVGMSRATLVRRFQEAIGMAPMTYLTKWRVTKAYNLAKYSQTAIERIAEEVGFGSARSLSKAFQRTYGYTPNALRLRSTDDRGTFESQ